MLHYILTEATHLSFILRRKLVLWEARLWRTKIIPSRQIETSANQSAEYIQYPLSAELRLVFVTVTASSAHNPIFFNFVGTQYNKFGSRTIHTH